MMVLGSETFQRYLSHKSGTLMNGLVPSKRGPSEISSPFRPVRSQQERAPSPNGAGAVIWDFAALEL